MGVNVCALSILALSFIPCPEELYLVHLGRMKIIGENNFRQEEQHEQQLGGGKARCAFQAELFGVRCVRGDDGHLACRGEGAPTNVALWTDGFPSLQLVSN